MAKILPINGLDRVKLSDAVPLDAPFSAFVFPTTFCNFKCVYCAHSLSREEMKKQYGFEKQTMSMETYALVIEQLRQFPKPLKLLSLTGHGEPLMNPNLPEMVKLAKDAGVAKRIEIISNASLLTHECSDALIGAGLDGLRVSLQGMNAEKYKEVCGWDLDFDEFIGNLRYFYEYKDNCDLFVKIMDVALEDGEDELFYKTFDPISDRMYIEKCRPVYSGVEFTENLRSEVLDRYGNTHERREVCPLCFFMISVFPDGDVEPCDTIYKPIVLGNIHNETLTEMFGGERLREFQRMQLRGLRRENSKCAVCVAPDDVSHPLDALDDDADAILVRLGGGLK
ncbi:radical SAM protein [Clostridia bacterium]|nr:radical SAM protein [Clostridia bacterium]